MKYEEKPTRKSFVDLEGNRFGMLTVLGYKGRDDKKQHLWHVQCDCGNDKVIIEAGMRAGATNSCVIDSHPSRRVRTVMVDGVKMKLKDLWKMFGIESTKSANNVFRMLNKDVYATLRKYGISTDKKIELLRLLD